MRLEIQWEMYDPATEREFIPSVNELSVDTIAQAQKWVRDHLPGQESGGADVDAVVISEIGSFADPDGGWLRTRHIGTYEPQSDEWTWADDR